MRTLSNIKSKVGKKARKRVGRGPGSGTGTYSGRGIKGQKSRAGGKRRPGFEGGRTPLIRQIPKLRGFRSIHKKAQPVNLFELDSVFSDGDMVNAKILQEKGLIDDSRIPVKLLGVGSITKKFQIENIRVSRTAKKAVEKAGGSVTITTVSPKKKLAKKSN